MKIRIQKNDIRIRLTSDEIIALVAGKNISSEISFSPKNILQFKVASAEIAEIQSEFDGCMVLISIPESIVKNWSSMDQITVGSTQKNGTENPLRILIEKDFARSHD